jgi:hypothetical protein
MERQRKWLKELYEILPYQEIFSNEKIKITRKVQIIRKEVDINKAPIIEYKLILFIFDTKTNKELKNFSFFSVKVNDPKAKYTLDLGNLKDFCLFLKNKVKENGIAAIESEIIDNMISMLKYVEIEEEDINKFLENFKNFYNNYLGRIN